MQLLDLFPNTDTIQTSYSKLINTLNTILSNSSGTTAPSADLQTGQLFFDTDIDLYQYYNGATWENLNVTQFGGASPSEYMASVVGSALSDCSNTTLAPGWYYCTSAGTSNIPTSVNGMLAVLDFPTNKQQIYFTNNTTAEIYTRRYNGTGWDTWIKSWNSANDGPGSGLDADTLDGVQLATIQSDIDAKAVLASANTFTATQTIKHGSTTSNLKIDSILGQDAKIDLLENGVIAISITNDASANQVVISKKDATGAANASVIVLDESGNINVSTGTLKVNNNTVWHPGNDGAGSGLDADTLDGTQLATIQADINSKQPLDADIPTVAASQAEMETGTETALRSMSPLRVAQAIAALAASTFPKAIQGLVPSNAADADHDITISTGSAVADDDTTLLELSAAMTKQIDATWAAGNNAGGLFSGTVAADTTYHLFIIEKDSDGSIDAGFDTSVTAANIPAGYTRYRRVASFITDASSNLIAFGAVEAGGGALTIQPSTRSLEVSSTSLSIGGANLTLSVIPADVVVSIDFYSFLNNSSPTFVIFTSTTGVNLTPAATNSDLSVISTGTRSNNNFTLLSDTQSRIRYRSTEASVTNFTLGIVAWTDFRN